MLRPRPSWSTPTFRHSHWMCLALICLGRCATPSAAPAGPRGDLLAILASPETPTDSRQAADRQWTTSHDPRDPTRLAILEQLVYAPGHTDDMRIYALDQLAHDDPTRAGRVLELYLPKMESWPVLRHACTLAVQLADLRLVEPLIRSLARPATSYTRFDRPEAGALEQLTGRPLEQTLSDQLLTTRDRSVQVAALDLLSERLGTAATIHCVRELADAAAGGRAANTSGRVFLEDVMWWFSLFDTLPSGPQEADWVQQLHRPIHAGLIAKAAAAHRRLRERADHTMAPRFVSVLAWVPPRYLEMSREQLLEDLGHRLRGQKGSPREASYPHAPDDRDETLEANAARLQRGDLLAMEMLLEALEQPGFRAEVLRLGLADMSDTTSEHGGLLAFQPVADGSSARLWPVLYAPLYSENDQAYMTGDKLLADMMTGLAPFHFHFQQVFNNKNAGPGRGDLQFVADTRCNAVVFTSTGKGLFDVDYYTPAGAVVDLGQRASP